MKVAAIVNIGIDKVLINNENAFVSEFSLQHPSDFINVYKALEIHYPKFYKMDALSKLGFLAVEILKLKRDFNSFPNDKISLIFQNSYASLDTDVNHQNNISHQDKTVSPATFVYTLPNIMLGEIAIRNKLFGENLFTLATQFSLTQFEQLVTSQFALNKADAVIGGWVDVYKEMFEVNVYFIDKDSTNNKIEIK